MKSTRVLITTYQSAFLRPGGGEAELNNLVDILHQLGISADIYGSTSMNIDAYDIVLHFSVHEESFAFIQSIKDMGKKVILWPNLWWGTSPSESDLRFAKSFLELADVVVFKSQSELSNVFSYAPMDHVKYEIVPWHIDKKFLEPVKDDLFRNMYSLDKYILWVGVIEQAKNQLAAIEALYDYSLPLVFIGHHRDKEYFDLCREKASKDTLFLPFMAQGSDILRSAYHGCSIYMELSSDPAGLSSLEAAVYEKPMILGRNDWSIEEFGDDIALIDAEIQPEIVEAADLAMQGKYTYSNKQKIIKNHLTPESLAPLVSLIDGLDGNITS